MPLLMSSLPDKQVNSCIGAFYPQEYPVLLLSLLLFFFFLFSLYLGLSGCFAFTSISLLRTTSSHLFSIPYFTALFSQDPGLCSRILSIDINSGIWCLSEAPSIDSNPPQLLCSQDVALLLLHCARPQKCVLLLLEPVPSILSRAATLTTFYNYLLYLPL